MSVNWRRVGPFSIHLDKINLLSRKLGFSILGGIRKSRLSVNIRILPKIGGVLSELDEDILASYFSRGALQRALILFCVVTPVYF
jgi:hypothetical protein